MSKVIRQSPREPAGKKARGRVFLCLQDLLAYYGQVAPDRNAILAPGCPPITYGALWARTNDTVRGLRSLGVGPSDRVAVVLPNGPEAAVAMIGVAAGAVCVPLNPGFTAAECQRYFGDLRLSALMTRGDTDSPSRGVAQNLGLTLIDLAPGPNAGPFTLLAPAAGKIVVGDMPPGAGDAFVLLTSGTSSRPKMVPLTQTAVCLSAFNVSATLALGPRDRLLNVLPLFHVHGLVSGVLAALAAGSSVVCTAGFDASAFFGHLKEFGPTWYTAVPAIHRALISAGLGKRIARRSSLRLVRSASSSLPPEMLAALEALFGVPVINTYGMTEAASQIAANPLGRRKPGSVGQPAGVEIAILDHDGRRLPAGKRGEIALRGPTITRGYDNDAAATKTAFRDGWFRTGDLGYLDRGGYLFIVGRIKDIINRGGQKVAPAEVEQALLDHRDVVEVAAFSIFHRSLGEDVAAAVVLREGAEVSADILRDFARERLARFKVPSLIRFVPEIPKGLTGKIKRDELIAAFSTAPLRGKLDAPCSDLERQLADTWMKLLEVNQIGIHEDVLTLGADSLAMTEMLLHLRLDFGVEFSFKDIFDAPTVAALAAHLESSQTHRAAVPQAFCDPSTNVARGAGDGPTTVSIVQEHMLRIERKLPGLLSQFNLSFAYRLRGPLNVQALGSGLTEVMRRHASLRTRFAWRVDLPIAIIAPAVELNLFIAEDLRTRTSAGSARAKPLLLKRAKLEAEREAFISFDISRAPLFRARLLRLDAADHVLLLTTHEMIMDGWSMGILIEEVSALYAAFAAGRPAQLTDPLLQFSAFARWQRRWSTGNAAAHQLAYWRARLRDVVPVFPRKNGAEELLATRIAQEPVHLSNDLVARLSALSRRRGATLFMTLLAGFKTLLLARSGRNDICVATTTANRSQPRAERVIGPIANTTLIRTRLDADLSFQEALSRVRDSVLEAYARQELPFDILAARLGEEVGLDPASLIQVYFVLQNPLRRSLNLVDVAVQPFSYQERQPITSIDRTWLRTTLRKTPSGITGTCNYKDELFEPGALRHWITDYKTILAKAASSPEMSLGRLSDFG